MPDSSGLFRAYNAAVESPKPPIKLDYRRPVRRRGMSDRQKAMLILIFLGGPVLCYLVMVLLGLLLSFGGVFSD